MWHSAGLQRFTTRIAGSTQVDDVAGADIVVITAGVYHGSALAN
jgi:malate/lactate dehydrogenase